jgi:hypothetical protein
MRLVFALVLACSSAVAQKPPEPTTKIEAFTAKTGVVVIQGFTNVGRIDRQGGVSVDARQMLDASNPASGVYGISVEVKQAGRMTQSNSSFIDIDEVDALVRGLDYIAKVTRSVTALNDFEVSYRTKGDFTITVFTASSGELSVSVASGRIGGTRAFLHMSDIPALRSAFLEGKRVAEAARIAAK